MYSLIQSSIALFASEKEEKEWSQMHSSFMVRMNLSTTPFCSGVYGVMYSVFRPWAFINCKYAFEEKIKPLSLLRVTPQDESFFP